MKLSLVRACAILLYTHACACGGSPFGSETLEYFDARQDISSIPIHTTSDGQVSDEDSSSQSDAYSEGASLDAPAVPTPTLDAGSDWDSPSPSGDSETPYDSGVDVVDTGVMCCRIDSGGPCSVGEIFSCGVGAVSCSASDCTFTDPGVGTCLGKVTSCQ